MNNQKIKDILKDPNTNWKHIMIVVILALLIVSGILICVLTEKEIEIPIIKLPEGMSETTGWKIYSNQIYHVALKYPKEWHFVEEYGGKKYAGENGFFLVSALRSPITEIEDICKNEALNKLQPYGSHPKIEKLQIKEQEGCLILPSSDQAAFEKSRACLIIRFPVLIQISQYEYNFLILYADSEHIKKIAQTLEFIF